MSQDNDTSKQTERDQEAHRCDDAPASAKASTGSTQMDLGTVPNWTSDEYCRECADLRDKKRFDAMAVDSMSLVMYNCSCFHPDTTFDA